MYTRRRRRTTYTHASDACEPREAQRQLLEPGLEYGEDPRILIFDQKHAKKSVRSAHKSLKLFENQPKNSSVPGIKRTDTDTEYEYAGGEYRR